MTITKFLAALLFSLSLFFAVPAPVAVAVECQTVDMFLKKVNLPEQVVLYQLTGEKAKKLSDDIGFLFDEFYMARLGGQQLGLLFMLNGCKTVATSLPELQWMEYMKSIGITPEDFKEFKGKVGV